MTTAITTYAQYQKHNFFRVPHWRWDRVLSLVDSDGPMPRRCTRRDDDIVRKARNFVLRWRNSDDGETRERLVMENPGLYYAYDYYQRSVDDPDAAMYLESRLLARQTPDEIAAINGMLPEAIQWYADLFFDVMPYLDNRDWITKQILLPALVRSNKADDDDDLPKSNVVVKPFLDGSLKMFAYFGGPFVADIMLSNFQAGKFCNASDDLAEWFDANVSMTVRRRAAQAAQVFDINKYNVIELLQTHAKIVEIAKGVDEEDRTKSAQEKQIQAMLADLPWAVGDDAERQYHGTVVGRFDKMASELRDDELLLIASGRAAPTLQQEVLSALPPPRPKRAALEDKDTQLP
jgi:hypothetical protein